MRKTFLRKQASQFLKITIISLITASPEVSLISIIKIIQRAGPTGVFGEQRGAQHVLQGTWPACTHSLSGKGAPGSELPTNEGTGTTATGRRPVTSTPTGSREVQRAGLGPPQEGPAWCSREHPIRTPQQAQELPCLHAGGGKTSSGTKP